MFQNFSPRSRVWIYQSDRPFSKLEITSLNARLNEFSQEWTAHNSQLKAIGKVIEDRFILLMVDETQNTASGCSIDKSVHFLKSLQNEMGFELFNRSLISYTSNGENETVNLSDLDDLLAAGRINAETVFFNTLIHTKLDFDELFKIPLHKSWLMQFVTK